MPTQAYPGRIAMDIARTGIVLYTELYEECVEFYSRTLGLRILFENDELTCFDFGGAYLMVERGGVANQPVKGVHQNPTCIRFNVRNIAQHVQALVLQGIAVDYQEFSWGCVAKFSDPDGNICALRDEETFVKLNIDQHT